VFKEKEFVLVRPWFKLGHLLEKLPNNCFFLKMGFKKVIPADDLIKIKFPIFDIGEELSYYLHKDN